MKKVLLALVLISLSACGHPLIVGNTGKESTPDSVDVVQGCYYGWGSETCRVIFDDGKTGYTVQSGTQSYFCKGQNL